MTKNLIKNIKNIKDFTGTKNLIKNKKKFLVIINNV
jgi:hypothetical protein